MNSLILKPLGMTVKINALSLIGGKKLYIFLTNPCYFSDCMFICVCVRISNHLMSALVQRLSPRLACSMRSKNEVWWRGPRQAPDKRLLSDWVMASPDDSWWEAPCLRTTPATSPEGAPSLHPLHCTPLGGEDTHSHVTVSLQTPQAPQPTGETWEETSSPTDNRANKRRRRGWQCRATSSPGDSVLSQYLSFLIRGLWIINYA